MDDIRMKLAQLDMQKLAEMHSHASKLAYHLGYTNHSELASLISNEMQICIGSELSEGIWKVFDRRCRADIFEGVVVLDTAFLNLEAKRYESNQHLAPEEYNQYERDGSVFVTHVIVTDERDVSVQFHPTQVDSVDQLAMRIYLIDDGENIGQ